MSIIFHDCVLSWVTLFTYIVSGELEKYLCKALKMSIIFHDCVLSWVTLFILFLENWRKLSQDYHKIQCSAKNFL